MLTCQKDRFTLPEGLHFLNCAYMSPMPRAVEEAGMAGLLLKRDPRQIDPRSFFTGCDRLRERFGRLVNAEASRVALVPSVSYGMATVARNLTLGRGQTIVVVRGQFPSNVYPWRRLATDAEAEVLTVSPPERTEGRGREWNARLLEAIDGRTGLVALPNVHWADGTRFDLEAIGRRAREVGAALVVDGTQSVGALPFDVRAVQPDALIVAGYKWLMGPYSLGLAYYGPRFDGGVPLEENWLLRRGSEDFTALVDYEDEYQPGATRFDMGERSSPVTVPMLSAALDLLLEWTPARIQAYAAALTADLLSEATALGYAVEEPAWRGAHLFGLRLPEGADMARLSAALRARGVAVSVRGDAVRVSPHLYNDASDVAALTDALRAAR